MTPRQLAARTILLAALGVPALTTAAAAASVTVSDTATGLAGVAAATAAILLDAGAKPRDSGNGVMVVEIKNFHCDQRSNGAADASSVHAGLPTLKCRINVPNRKDATGGQPFGEARAMTDLLGKIQDAAAGNGVAFSDCAMGYCGIFAKSIKCTIDTRVDNYRDGGRWVCEFADGQ